ncbi:YitT family protein [Faecalicatena sp. AGMB00832]|uniref:YitT family protein n=1 Tax=Faecalicatena faecalis TaxID=2726362 RepID=A0ABS6D1B1_9FIRM|nr:MULTISPECIES: DUF6198 family protein [Faecalicatena]MBU3875006.1 YitT family protein [Faecalicatena faecalis]MCI6466770.1 DUF6198 family protein [Faecalicatena sp.]MDY5620563.1 DUF6198 family protein [Lachnospiraceae bacterium]
MKSKFSTKKVFEFLLGTALNAMGISLITKAYLGTSPLSSVPFVLSLGLKPSFGTFTFILNMLFLLLQILLLKKSFPKMQFLQIPVTIFFGFLIDVFMYMFQEIKPVYYFSSLILLVIGCAVMAFGIMISVHADLVTTPGNSLVQALSNCTKVKFGNMKIALDCTLSAIAVICSFMLFDTFRGVREGTLISAILVGVFINLFQRYAPSAKAEVDIETNTVAFISDP